MLSFNAFFFLFQSFTIYFSFRSTLTYVLLNLIFNVKKNNLKGEVNITSEHVKNNKDIRGLLGKSGIKPEELPAEEAIKKLERRVKSLDKEVAKKNLKGK